MAATVAVLALATSSGPGARADDVGDAKDLFARGREARSSGDCAGAVVLFRKAYALYPAGLGSLRNIAECEESLGHFASARRDWLDLRRALLVQPDSKYAGWTDDADQAAARLAPRIAHLTVLVDRNGASGGPDAALEVTVNGEPLPANLVGTPLDRDPGRYEIRARIAGAPEGGREIVDLASGDDQRVTVRLPSKLPAAYLVDAGSQDRSGTARRTAGFVAVGVGGASLVGAGVAAIVYQVALDDVRQHCPDYQHALCPPSLRPTADRGHVAATLVDVLLPVGAVGAAAGVVLLTTHFGRGASGALTVSPRGVAAVGEF